MNRTRLIVDGMNGTRTAAARLALIILLPAELHVRQTTPTAQILHLGEME